MKFKTEFTTRNGVRVKKTTFFDDQGVFGTSVEADCDCLGHFGVLHSNMFCPNLERQRSEALSPIGD